MTAETSPRGGRITRLAALPAALLTTLAFAGVASGNAEVGTFHDEHSFSDAITDSHASKASPGRSRAPNRSTGASPRTVLRPPDSTRAACRW